jgi:hypothetical protein
MILSITCDRKTLKEIKREYIESDDTPNYTILVDAYKDGCMEYLEKLKKQQQEAI